MTTDRPSAPGRVGGYELLDRVATSATRSVWHVRNHALGRDVALKQVAAGAVRSLEQLGAESARNPRPVPAQREQRAGQARSSPNRRPARRPPHTCEQWTAPAVRATTPSDHFWRFFGSHRGGRATLSLRGTNRRNRVPDPRGPHQEGTDIMNEQRVAAGWYADPTGMNDSRVQRYWDGSRWTAHRVWNGAQWVETAQGAAAPVMAPLAVPPTHRHRGVWIGVAVVAAVVGVVVAVAASAGGSHKGPRLVAARTSSPAPGVGTATQTTAVDSSSDLPSAGSANPMRAWENSTGDQTAGSTNAQAIKAVAKDIATIGKDYSSQADDTTLLNDCQRLGPGGDGSFIPTDSPDQTVNANLTKASEYLTSGYVDCDVDDQAAATELNKVIDYLNTAISEIKALGG